MTDNNASEMHDEIVRLLAEMGDFSLDDDGLCSLKIDGKTELTLEAPRGAPYFMLHSAVAAVAPGSKSDTFEKALAISFDNFDDTGMRLAFRKETGHIILLFTSDYAVYDLTDFADTVVAFGQRADQVYEFLLQ